MLLLLLACRGGVDSAGPEDLDGDGFSVEEDCDDRDASVFPGAIEVCNGLDDDCDGAVDDTEDMWFVDVDGDRYGDPETAQARCTEGLVADGTDCDDGDETVHPGATEWCDDVDQDCDGEIDEEPADAVAWFDDADGDGFGAGDPHLDCVLPDGAAEQGGDCDDLDPDAFPGATEWCDGVDQDCDGQVDDDAADAPDWWTDADGDGFGVEPRSRACTAPSGHVDNDDDCDDSAGAVNPDADELCNGVDDDCDGRTDPSDSLDADSWYADADGDGYGSAAYTVDACEQPSGYVDDDSDCDDGDAGTNPDTVWYMDFDGDGYGDASVTTTACSQPSGFVADDTDCDDADGQVWEESTFYADGDGDGYGDSTGGTVAACSAPSGYAATDDDCDDGDADVNPGATESCNGKDDDCDGNADGSGVCAGCDFETNNGDSYLFCNTSTATWADARAACQGVGYDLLTINDSAENAWVTSTHSAKNMGSPWMGFQDQASEGSWGWASGESVTYTNWNSGEPNNSGNEDCGHIYTSGKWNDAQCGSGYHYICEL